MTITEKLLKADTKKVSELLEGTYESKALARALGEKDPVEIKIREVQAKLLNEYLDGVVDTKGNVNLAKGYEAGKKILVAGLVDPDLKDKELQKYFGCALGVDLAEKLFKNEVLDISTAIQNLSDVETVDEEEIKN